jgi:hypothetical protein
MNYPHPLIKQIKQEIMEEIITNEKTTCKQNKRVNAESPSVIKKKKVVNSLFVILRRRGLNKTTNKQFNDIKLLS